MNAKRFVFHHNFMTLAGILLCYNTVYFKCLKYGVVLEFTVFSTIVNNYEGIGKFIYYNSRILHYFNSTFYTSMELPKFNNKIQYKKNNNRKYDKVKYIVIMSAFSNS
jgi:hypothetical protein